MNLIRKLIIAATAATVAPLASAAEFNQGTIDGMPDVMVMNAISALELAKAPDTVMFRVAGRYVMEDQKFWQTPSRYQTSSISVDRESHVSLAPLLGQGPLQSKPSWAECPPDYEVITDAEKDAAPGAKVGGFQRSKMVSSCGPTPGSEAKLNAFIDHAMRLVRKVQEDTKKATQMAFLVPLHFNPEYDIELLSRPDAGAAVNVAELDQQPIGNMRRPPQRTAAGVAIRIGWGDNLSRNGLLSFCTSPYSVEDSRSQSMSRHDDISRVCYAMRGMAGMTLPTHLMVRDISQFKLGDDLRLAVVFTPEEQGAKSKREDGSMTKVVTAKPAYAQVVDVRTKKAIGDKFPFDKEGAFVFLRPSECYMRVTGTHKNANASAERGCANDELRNMAMASGKPLLQSSREELRSMESALIAKSWGK